MHGGGPSNGEGREGARARGEGRSKDALLRAQQLAPVGVDMATTGIPFRTPSMFFFGGGDKTLGISVEHFCL